MSGYTLLTTVLYIVVTCFLIKLQAGSDVAVFCCLDLVFTPLPCIERVRFKLATTVLLITLYI